MKKHKIRLTKKPRVVMSSQAEFLKRLQKLKIQTINTTPKFEKLIELQVQSSAS